METGRLRVKETWMIHEEIFQWGETFPYKECLSYWNVFGYNYIVDY